MCHSLAAAESQSGLQYAPAPWSFSDRRYFPVRPVTFDWEDLTDTTLRKLVACKTNVHFCQTTSISDPVLSPPAQKLQREAGVANSSG